MERLNRPGAAAGDFLTEPSQQADVQRIAAGSPMASKSNGGLLQTMSTIFGRHSRHHMFALIVGTLAMNIVLYGHMYAFPKVSIATHSSLAPGYQGLSQQCVGLLP